MALWTFTFTCATTGVGAPGPHNFTLTVCDPLDSARVYQVYW